MVHCLPTRRLYGSRVRYCAKEDPRTDREPSGAGEAEGARGGWRVLDPGTLAWRPRGRLCCGRFWKREARARGLGYRGSPGRGVGLPGCRCRLDGLRGRPGRSRRGTPPGCCLGNRPGPAGRVVGPAVATGSYDGPAAGRGKRDDPAAGTARPGVRGAGTGSRGDPATGTARPGGRGALRASGAGERGSATRRSRRVAARCGEPGLRRSRSCGRCAGRPRRSL